MSDEVTLDWSTATVKDGKLRITVGGSPPKHWKDAFERSVRLLQGGGGDWGEVKAKKNAIDVDSVTPGSEEKLRHFLEAVVQQVNAHDEDDDADEDGDGSDPDDDTPDGQMTKRFREFGEEQAAEGDPES